MEARVTDMREKLARRARLTLFGVAAAVAAAGALAPVGEAADPGRWTQVNATTLPLYYYQGMTVDPARHVYFDGIFFGLYKTDPQLNEIARNDTVIPPEVALREGYDHIGDLAWSPGGANGRLLLPLECYYPIPGAPYKGNTCPAEDLESGELIPGTGAIGVADAGSLQWQYYVKLNETRIRKTMWAEISPDEKLLWTQGGQGAQEGGPGGDLLAYSVGKISPENAAPDGAAINAVRKLKGVVPLGADGKPLAITGATFYGERMYVAVQEKQLFRVYSLDVDRCSPVTFCERRLEIERTVTGESEGLATGCILNGVLHWQIQPYNTSGLPTYGLVNGMLLTFVPADGRGLEGDTPVQCGGA